jgi:nicotinate-nucleotide adenylyltransferase
MMRVGVLGGTFDPVHYGHLLLAQDAMRAASLDRVLFMPAHIQPFKQDVRVSGDAHRIAMLRLAVAGNDAFDVTEVETSHEGVSYTIDSLRRLRSEYSDSVFYFIVGVDMFLSLRKWKEHDALLREFGFVCGRRPGYREDELKAAATAYREEFGTGIVMADNTLVDISSSEIRSRVAKNTDIRYLTPEAVIEYIEKYGLYRT